MWLTALSVILFSGLAICDKSGIIQSYHTFLVGSLVVRDFIRYTGHVALIESADIATVRERARIDEIVSGYVSLRNAGTGQRKGLCPFHDEKTPSFHVTPAKGLYYCFGCGEGGDVIDFVMAMDQVTFAEAVEMLADRVGITLRYTDENDKDRENRTRRRDLVAVNTATAEYFQEMLHTPAAEPARQFLLSRGFPEESWKHFGVGYAPTSGLLSRLQQLNFTDDNIRGSGVVGVADNNTTYERFRDRIIWPITDLSGDIVGFGGRRLSDDNGPKYLNTPETLIYRKSEVLYGAAGSRKHIAKNQQAIVVEGYTDVMACHLAGITTAVASCGTAFGAGHVKVLRRLLLDDGNAEIIFTFDGDEAGQKAAERVYSSNSQFQGRTYICVAPDGQDPCDLRLHGGDDAVKNLIDNKKPLFEFILQREIARHDTNTADGRAIAMRAGAKILRNISDSTLQREYIRQMAGWFGADPGTITELVQKTHTTSQPQKPHQQPTPQSLPPLDMQTLQIALQHPELISSWWNEIDETSWSNETAARIWTLINTSTLPRGNAEWLHDIINTCTNDNDRNIINKAANTPIPATTIDERYAIATVARLLDIATTNISSNLRAELAHPNTDQTKLLEIQQHLLELEKYRRELRQHWAPE